MGRAVIGSDQRALPRRLRIRPARESRENGDGFAGVGSSDCGKAMGLLVPGAPQWLCRGRAFSCHQLGRRAAFLRAAVTSDDQCGSSSWLPLRRRGWRLVSFSWLCCPLSRLVVSSGSGKAMGQFAPTHHGGASGSNTSGEHSRPATSFEPPGRPWGLCSCFETHPELLRRCALPGTPIRPDRFPEPLREGTNRCASVRCVHTSSRFDASSSSPLRQSDVCGRSSSARTDPIRSVTVTQTSAFDVQRAAHRPISRSPPEPAAAC